METRRRARWHRLQGQNTMGPARIQGPRCLRVGQCRSYSAYQSDFSKTFLQGKPVERLLCVSQRPEGVPGLHPRQLLRMRKESYDSVAAPSQWRDILMETMQELGWKMNDMDLCIFVLKSTTAIAVDGIHNYLKSPLLYCHNQLNISHSGPFCSCPWFSHCLDR